ncbi:HAMP domain-containing histidine kinase [Ramlibacter henchirensis]|uniref:histidine kinase n=1 Tax=Ramlibacter henchirensis TaxID=204072 RepID=A0A4Z0C2A7_9BURK|nr:HAMP domain-containing sensor histidine kinase [Ramlibacter henchirensis]TFZ05666.1 HAMP domain-containing histidine kinase [Ramlibacter henchirensis]
MTISGFIKEQLGPIVDEWVEFARTRVPLQHDFTREELADHARVLLLAIAADIEQAQGAQEKHDKAQGNDPENAPEVTRMARDHAAQRFVQGFSFDHLVSEFRALRASVIRRWTKQIDQARPDHLDDLTRFGEAMDQALSESASLYTRKVDDSRNLLLGVLGHDLRTPLGVVHMSASYLLRSDTLDGAQTKAAARILTSADRMSAMVKDILDFTQTAFGVTLPLSPAPADMGELAKTIVVETKTLVPECQVELFTQGELAGRWDGARIGQMLSNLLANAVQHGEKTEPVSVRVTGDGNHVSVEVRNKGAPIPQHAQKTLFLPLRQAPTAEGERRAGSSGLGLGLYITREIAVAHGGSIEVASNADRTTFTARLPRTPPPWKDRRSGASRGGKQS